MQGVISDLTGDTFGRLTVIELLGTTVRSRGRNHERRWSCRCVCGNSVEVSSNSLLSGHTTSCGCRQRDVVASRVVHGDSRRTTGRTPEYIAWQNMIRRCTDPNNISYHNYGGRGIHVCRRWLRSFSNFLVDMGRRPSAKHSIDRIENNLHYTPGNCKWSTKKEQANNTRRVRDLEKKIKSLQRQLRRKSLLLERR